MKDFWYRNTFLLVIRHPVWITRTAAIFAFKKSWQEVYGTKSALDLEYNVGKIFGFIFGLVFGYAIWGLN